MWVAVGSRRLTEKVKLGKNRAFCGHKLGMETSPSPVPVPVTKPNSLFSWRFHRLIASGFDHCLGEEVAQSDVDLHELLALLDRGCTPALAVRILAPIDEAKPGGRFSPVSPWPPGSTTQPTPRGSL